MDGLLKVYECESSLADLIKNSSCAAVPGSVRISLDHSDMRRISWQPSEFSRNSTRSGECIIEAFRLQARRNRDGVVYWVEQFEGTDIYHAYYVPSSAMPEDNALNQADNGYEGYPALKAWQVVENGIELFESSTLPRCMLKQYEKHEHESGILSNLL